MKNHSQENNSSIYRDKDVIFVKGPLKQDSVTGAFEQCLSFLAAKDPVKIDLIGVTQCDSSSLAFLTALMRESKKRDVQITFLHIPKQMLDLGKVSGINELLPIVDN